MPPPTQFNFPPGSFLERYLAYCGDSEVPVPYNVWCGISLVAAALGNRVWIEKLPGAKLVPNLYVLMIGPSGLGKGRATDIMLGLAAPLAEELHLIRGKMTGQSLADWASRKHENHRGQPVAEPHESVYLINEELAMSIGSGAQADSFVKYMTGLYMPGPAEIPFFDGTRTSGIVKLAGSLRINWLAGTTERWLMDSVGRDAIEGGFFGRTAVVEGEYNFDRRQVRPRRPPQYEEIQADLRERLGWFLDLNLPAEILQTPQARDIEKNWYESRPRPADDTLFPSWQREQDLVLKICMVLAASEWSGRYRARGRAAIAIDHLIQIQAFELARSAKRPMKGLLATVSATPATKPMIEVEKVLKRLRVCDHTRLLQRMSPKGFNRRDVAEAVAGLVEQGKVAVEVVQAANGRPKRVYRWVVEGAVAFGPLGIEWVVEEDLQTGNGLDLEETEVEPEFDDLELELDN